MKPVTFAETLERVKTIRSKPEYALLLPLLQRQKIKLDKENIFDPDIIEWSLLSLGEEAWQSVSKPSILKREDDTYQTGDPFFDELEDALSQGGDIDGILRRLQPA